jgi:hypothetical protein
VWLLKSRIGSGVKTVCEVDDRLSAWDTLTADRFFLEIKLKMQKSELLSRDFKIFQKYFNIGTLKYL